MNRTIKFQLSNIKKTYSFSALINYGVLALFWLIAFLFDGPEFVSNMTMHPLWLNIVTLIFIPFTSLALLYALFDGLMFFDTSLRFGISRKSYFVSQMIIYVLLTLLLVIASGLSEVPWTGTASSQFAQIGRDYLSFENFSNEWIKILGTGVGTLFIYRFKAKALIPLIFIGPVLGIIAGVSYSMSENTFMIDAIINMVDFIMNNPNLTASIIIALLASIYYLFVTNTEVQD